MLNFKRKDSNRKNKQANTATDHKKQEITSGTWVYEANAPLIPMCIGKILGFGMCEVIYGKSKPFRVYKRRIATLRPLNKQEMHLVSNSICHEIKHTALMSA